jgi:hypothetical protein
MHVIVSQKENCIRENRQRKRTAESRERQQTVLLEKTKKIRVKLVFFL